MRKQKMLSRRGGDFCFSACLAVMLAMGGLVASPAAAEHTRFWRQSEYANFEQGTAQGVALRSDGKLVLAPKLIPFADTNLGYLRALRLDSQGNLFAAGGANAKVVRFDPSGNATTVFESEELSAQALVADKSDNIYVATLPDGKVYKIAPEGQGEKSVFFDPKTKYIWDLVLGPDGVLYVATGDTGKIFSVTPDGKSEEFYSDDEAHIRVLALDNQGNLLAGTEPNGRVLRIPLGAATQTAGDGSREGVRRAYVLYETPKQEITALLTDPAGNLYVAGIGDKTRVLPASPQTRQQQPQQQQQARTTVRGQGQSITITAGAGGRQRTTQSPFLPFPTVTTSAVYHISPDGSPEEIWASRQDVVYALSLSVDGNLLLGIGNQGGLIQLESNGVFSRLAKTESAQVTGFARAPDGKVYVATANPGKVLALGPELESQGTFESEAFDARIFSRWGRLTWFVENTTGANSGVELYVRSGNTSNPANDWSPWYGPYRDAKDAKADCPAARFVQWKGVLQSGSSPASELSWVNLAYLPKNVAPRFDSIVVQDPGIRAARLGGQTQGRATPVQLRLPATSASRRSASTPQRPSPAESSRSTSAPRGSSEKGFQAVLWSASDANDDDLRYAIYFRGEGEKGWKPLEEKLDQKFHSWDTTSMADGAYYLKIVASDAESNPPDMALQAEGESERFVVDNTPPDISSIMAGQSKDGTEPSATVRFGVHDSTSAIVRAQYSLDAGEWILASPVGALSDSPEAEYAVTLENVPPGEHTVAVRVYDQFENVAAAKVTFVVSAEKR